MFRLENLRYGPYSFSRMSEYLRCPRKFYFKYVRHLPDLVGEAGQFGRLVHEAIQLKLSNQDYEKVLAGLDEERYVEALEMIQRAEEIIKKFKVLKVYGSEIDFGIDKRGKLVDFNSDQAVLRGIIDYAMLVEGIDRDIVMLVDWKTGHVKPNPLQLQIYLSALSKNKEAQGLFAMLRSGQIIIVERDERAFKKVLNIIERIENDKEFQPTPGRHCSFCSYVSLCPLAKEIENKDIPTIQSPEDFERVVDEIEILQNKLKRWKEALMEYLKAINQPLQIKEKVYKIKYVPHYHLKAENKAELWARVYKEHPELLTFSNSEVSKYYPEFFEEKYYPKLEVE